MIRLLVPWALLALILPLGVLVFSRRKALWWRALTMTLLVLALTQPQVARRPDDSPLFVLVDRSESVAHASEASYRELLPQLRDYPGPVGLIEFAATPQLSRPPGDGVPPLSASPPAAEALSTDIGASIDLALGMIGVGGGQILLVSDAQPTSGDMWAAASRARERRVPVSVVPVEVEDPVRVVSLEGPQQAPLGTVELRGRIEATTTVEAEIIWRSDGRVLDRSVEELTGGIHEVSIAARLDEPGAHSFTLEVEVDDDPIPGNNRLNWVVQAGEPSTVLVVGESMRAARLVEEAGLEAMSTQRFSTADLAGVELVVLDNWPLSGLSRSDVDALRTYVTGGGGLLVIQGRTAVEGYAGALEEVLPVTYSVPARLEEDATAIIFVLDRSASMVATTAGAQHIDLLKEATAAAVEAMHPEDFVGAIAFDRYPASLIDPGPVEEVRQELYENLRALRPIGGTDLVPAVRRALEELEGLDARIRHMVILSDGKTLPRPDLPELYEEVRRSGVGVTSIALGAEADLGALGELAQAGQGELLVVEDARDLRQVFIGEAKEAARPRFRQGEFPVHVGPDAAALGLEQVDLPPLDGYVLTFPKALAEVGFIAPEGDPLVAAWQLGLGRAAVVNVDLEGRWSGRWLESPSLGELWGALVGWLWSPKEDVVLDWAVEHDEVRIRLDVEEDGRWVSGLQFRGELAGRNNAHELVFEPSAPGRYEARAPFTGAGSHVLSVWDETGRYGGTFGMALPYEPELASLGVDMEAVESLTQLTGGQVLSEAEVDLAPVAARARSWHSLHRTLLWAAAVVFLADLALRKLRLVFPRGKHAAQG